MPAQGGGRCFPLRWTGFAFFFLLPYLVSANSTAKIFGTDDRSIVADTRQFPFSAIGRVEANFPFEFRHGTGVLIGQKWVLTAGHLVYDGEFGVSKSVYFSPGRTPTKEPFGRIKTVRVIIRDEWTAEGNDAYDLALLELESSAGDQAGFFQIAIEPDGFFSNAYLTTAGYPEDKGESLQMVMVSGTTQGLSSNLIAHELDTQAGQSGSPLWFEESPGVPRLVGAIKGVEAITNIFYTTEHGIAVRITQPLADWIDKQLTDSGDIPPGIASPPPPASPCTSPLFGLGVASLYVSFTLLLPTKKT